jgi:hypothetical protein
MHPNHVLYRQDDCDAPEQILDDKGSVALSMCRICGLAESELDMPCYGAKAVHHPAQYVEIPSGADTGKLRYDLYPPEALDGTVRVLTFGAAKYSDRNWEKGMSWGRVFAALMRHLWSWWRGEDKDPETGESHLHHAGCCIAFLQTYEARKIGVDDRANKE